MFEFEFCPVQMIPMNRLELDPRFNRDIVRSTIAAIDKAPDPDKFGVLSVAMLNGHGMHTIYDGGHRFVFLQESGYEGDVPCMVGRVVEPHEVAIKFVEMQHDRRDVNPWERFKKYLFAEVPSYVAVERAVTSIGWTVGPKAIKDVVMPGPVLRILAQGQETGLARTLELARETWDGRSKATDGNLLTGLWRVIDTLGPGLDRSQFVDKLGEIDPADLLTRARERRARERGTVSRNVEREILRIYRARRAERSAA